MESEKTVKQPMGRPRKRLLESNGRVYRRKPTRTIDEPADGEETTSVKSVRYQYTMKKKQCADIVFTLSVWYIAEFISLKGRLAFAKEHPT